MTNEYFKYATNPYQYDAETMDWKKEGLPRSPTRQLFQEYLKTNLVVKGKSVIDIGSGMGQLFPLLKQLGAVEINGIEPSIKNVQISKYFYPDIEIYEDTLAKADIKKSFDVAVSVMVFEHIPDLAKAFKKIVNFLKPNGLFYLIVAEKSYAEQPRFDYKLDVVDIGNGEVIVKTVRPLGIIYDILRPNENYIKAAQLQGLVLEKKLSIKPISVLIKLAPKYLDFIDTTMSHLFIFRKNGNLA